MATIVAFALSLLVILTLVITKAIELKYGKKNIILELLSRLDSQSDKLITSFKFKALQIIQSVRYLLLIEAKNICKSALNKVEERIIKEYRLRQSAIMGHKDIVNKGSVSFYLKKITEEKSNGQKGKIE